MEDTKTATQFDLSAAQNLSLNDLRGLLTESAEVILRSIGGVPVPGLQAAPIDTRVFVKSFAPHLRMN